jgi:hypothetical protein
MVQKAKRSPYLADDNRLADVIAAIQAAGTYKFYKLDFGTWADRISGDVRRGTHWRLVFEEHPEFFRLDSAKQRASLILRRQRQKLYNVDDQTTWSRKSYQLLSAEEKLRFSRSPLEADEIEALIDVAINLHSRAAERARDKRWLVPPSLAFIGAMLGGLLPLLIRYLAGLP